MFAIQAFYQQDRTLVQSIAAETKLDLSSWKDPAYSYPPPDQDTLDLISRLGRTRDRNNGKKYELPALGINERARQEDDLRILRQAESLYDFTLPRTLDGSPYPFTGM